MRHCHRYFSVILSAMLGALLSLAQIAAAQNGTGIMMGSDMVLRVDHSRQLTLNAHIQGFLYQPTGDHIAYVSVSGTGDNSIPSLKYIGTHPNNTETQTVVRGTPGSIIELDRWSHNGRYLLFQLSDGSDPPQLLLADTGKDPFNVQTETVPLPPVKPTSLLFTAWAPTSDRIFYVCRNGGDTPSVAAIYDVVSGKTHTLNLPPNVSFYRQTGWLDDGHLQIAVAANDGQRTLMRYDLATDQLTPLTTPTTMLPSPLMLGYPVAQPSNPKVAGVTVEATQQELGDAQSTAKTTAWTIWVRRAAAPKAVSALAISVTPGNSGTPDPNSTSDQDDPQPQWSPDGGAVAFVSHGDLFQTTLLESAATAAEKYAAGEKLTCEEERQILISHLKQVGLGLLQYAQDYNEHYPAASGWQNAVMPYLKDSSLLNFAGIPIHYTPPTDLALAGIASPADFSLATADTPCAHIVLYADGHVKAFDKTQQ